MPGCVTRRGRGSSDAWRREQRNDLPSVSPADAKVGVGREDTRTLVRFGHARQAGVRALCRILELPGANPLKDIHAALAAAVLAACGFSAWKDLLAQLFELNLAVAQNI